MQKRLIYSFRVKVRGLRPLIKRHNICIYRNHVKGEEAVLYVSKVKAEKRSETKVIKVLGVVTIGRGA